MILKYKWISETNFDLKVFIYRINLQKTMKDGASLINIEEGKKSIGTLCIDFHGSCNSMTYFNRFDVENILKKYWQQKYYKEHHKNTSFSFDNMWRVLHRFIFISLFAKV